MAEIRWARSGELEEIVAKLRSEGWSIPLLNEDTIVAREDGTGSIIGFAAMRNLPFLYVHWDETVAGGRAAVRMLRAAEQVSRGRHVYELFAGVDCRNAKAMELASRCGFRIFQAELLHRKLLSDEFSE